MSFRPNGSDTAVTDSLPFDAFMRGLVWIVPQPASAATLPHSNIFLAMPFISRLPSLFFLSLRQTARTLPPTPNPAAEGGALIMIVQGRRDKKHGPPHHGGVRREI